MQYWFKRNRRFSRKRIIPVNERAIRKGNKLKRKEFIQRFLPYFKLEL